MSKREKKGGVPELRFPEFRNAGDWDADELGEIAEFVNEKISLERIALENYVSTENILPEYGGVARASKLPAMSSVTRFRPHDTLVSNIRPYLKKVWVADKEGGASNDVIVIRAKQRLLPQYFSFLLRNDAFIDYVMTGAKGVKMPRGDIGAMREYPALYPSKTEQQKIADCLTSVDELITAQIQKLAALKTHKKGLMQQLFPAEGETVPKLRFPEFRDAGEWVEKMLEQVAEYENGKAHEQDIDDQGKYIVVNSKFISTEGEVKKFTNVANLLAKKDDILMVLSDVPNGRAIAKCFYVDKDNTYSVNQRICKLTAKKNAVSLMLFYILDRNAYFLAFDDGVKQTNLKKEDVLNCPVLLPDDKAEQQKIADCLTVVDDLISNQANKVEALKSHKKGLMQQLFPAMDEVDA